MWKATFINQYGLSFESSEDELVGSNMLEYIKYCLDANSILVNLERI